LREGRTNDDLVVLNVGDGGGVVGMGVSEVLNEGRLVQTNGTGAVQSFVIGLQ
jgi:hypothetical protein